MDTGAVDALLERYLTLLDEYTQLRSRLNNLQSGMYHNIARANFSTERGLRYGSDHYDERMQAHRRLQLSTSEEPSRSGTSFTVTTSQTVPQAANEVDSDSSREEVKDGEKEAGLNEKVVQSTTKDPLKWFGILTPQPLRQAQGQAVEAVEECIPRMASLSAEMAEVEIEIRRARKKRSKAEAADKKQNLAASKEGVKV